MTSVAVSGLLYFFTHGNREVLQATDFKVIKNPYFRDPSVYAPTEIVALQGFDFINRKFDLFPWIP